MKIFGNVKQQLRRFFACELVRPIDQRNFTIPALMMQFNNIYNSLSNETIKRAWACLLGDLPDEESDDSSDLFEMDDLSDDLRDDSDSDFDFSSDLETEIAERDNEEQQTPRQSDSEDLWGDDFSEEEEYSG